MLLSLLFSGDFRKLLVGVLLIVPSVLICLSVHESAHGFAAYLLGDRTAKNSGRLTLDPLAHIDPLGFACMMLLGFGWARPVPVNISNFKNRRRDMGITALAGPLSNVLLAFLSYFAMAEIMLHLQTANNFTQILVNFFYYLGAMSVGLGVFNLIPIHPLDGSRILDAILPFKAQVRFQNVMQRYSSVILLAVIVVLWFGGLDILIGSARTIVSNWAYMLARALPF